MTLIYTQAAQERRRKTIKKFLEFMPAKITSFCARQGEELRM